MDFDLTDEQRLLKDSVDRLIADQYQFEQRKKYMAEPTGWSQSIWSQLAELGLLGLPFAESAGRIRRRRGGDHDRHGSLRPRPGAGAVFPHRDPGRRPAAPRRQRRAARRAGAADRVRRDEARLRAYRAPLALRPGQRHHHRAQGRRRLRAGRRQERGAARRLRRPHPGHRPHRRQPARPRRRRAVPGRSVRRRRDRAAATPRRTGCAPRN